MSLHDIGYSCTSKVECIPAPDAAHLKQQEANVGENFTLELLQAQLRIAQAAEVLKSNGLSHGLGAQHTASLASQPPSSVASTPELSLHAQTPSERASALHTPGYLDAGLQAKLRHALHAHEELERLAVKLRTHQGIRSVHSDYFGKQHNNSSIIEDIDQDASVFPHLSDQQNRHTHSRVRRSASFNSTPSELPQKKRRCSLPSVFWDGTDYSYFIQEEPVRDLQTLTLPAPVFGQKPAPEWSDDNIDQTATQAAVDGVEPQIISRPQNPQAHGSQTTGLRFGTGRLPVKPRLNDVDGSLRKRGMRKIAIHKRVFQVSQFCINGFFVFFTWYFAQYWYVLLPFISAAIACNVIMIFSLVIKRTWTAIRPEQRVLPDTPETLVYIVPCYNETKDELTRSLDSLVAQQKVDEHQQAVVIICDGRARGPGMEKTTADYLLEDILIQKDERKLIRGAYTAWDSQPMDVVVQRGRYKSLPYYCIIKQQNQGKRDGLIVVRSFLYNYNRRHEKPDIIMNQEYFDTMASWMSEDAKIDHVDDLIGMDADTVFDDVCAYELIESSRFRGTVGVAGYVAVDWKDKPWGFWRLYQNTEYTITQCLRRLHQGRVTHKVSCLPGACQLLKIREETCGDEVLVNLFGRCPDLTDGLLRQIQASASEDRNHVCHMLTARPSSKTRQALKALAYTDVPLSWAVYLSQRRRWSLGATGNDWLLCWAPGVQWFERILSIVGAMTWFLTPFVFAAYGSFIYAIVMHPSTTLIAVTSIMVIPVVYYIIIPVWFCKNFKEMCQFWAGLMIYIFFGPFCRIIVLCYSVKNIDSFGWGKTRQVIAEDNDDLGAKADKSQGPSTSELKKTPSEDLPERIDQGEEERKIGT